MSLVMKRMMEWKQLSKSYRQCGSDSDALVPFDYIAVDDKLGVEISDRMEEKE
jgi:hypothetical protein